MAIFYTVANSAALK